MRNLLLIIGISVSLLTQSKLAYSQKYSFKEGNIAIVGTANGHSWELQARDMECKANIVRSGNNLVDMRSLMFSVKVSDLKASNIFMNRGVYKALRGYPFDQVHYQGVYITVTSSGENTFEIKSEGNLMIAGVTRVTALKIHAVMNPDGSLTCTGSKAIKMSDFKVYLNESEAKRMSVGDEVILTFQLRMAPDQDQ